MAIKVGINGFGRIGRVALRSMVERGSSSYQICGINLRNADLDYMVYQSSTTPCSAHSGAWWNMMTGT